MARFRAFARGAGLVLVGLGVVVTLPVAMPLVALLEWRDRRRLRRLAARTPCAKCGAPLGTEAIARADEIWAENIEAWRATHPHALPRMVRHQRATCPACGAGYGHDPRGRRLILRAMEDDTFSTAPESVYEPR